VASAHLEGILLGIALACVVFVAARRSLAAAFAGLVAAQVASNSSIPWLKVRFLDARWGALAALALAALPVLRRGLPRTPWLASLALLPVFGFVSAAWSVDPRLSVERSVSFGALLVVVVAVGLACVSDEREQHLLLDGVAVLVVAVALASLAALALGDGTYNRQLRGIFENANGLGLFFGLAYPFLARWLVRRGLGGGRFVLVALCVAVGLASHSRSGLLATIVASVWFEWASNRNRWFFAAVVVAAVALGAGLVGGALHSSRSSSPPPLAVRALVLVVPPPTPDVTEASQSMSFAERLTGSRSDAWRAAIHLFDNRPTLGYGFGTGDQLFARYHVRFALFQGANPNDAYLQLLLEVGVVGCLVFLVPLGAAVGAAVRDRRAGSFGSSVGGGVLFAGLATAIVESIFTSAGAPWESFLWLGATLAVLRPQAAPVAARTSSRARRLWSAAASRPALAGGAGVLVVAAAITGILVARAHREPPVPPEAVRARTLAAKVCAGCAVVAQRRVVPGFWWVELHRAAARRAVCYAVDVELYRRALRDAVRAASCAALPLARQHMLSMGFVREEPPYFGPPGANPSGFEPALFERVAHDLGIGIVRWQASPRQTVPPRGDLVVHVAYRGDPAALPANEIAYYALYAEVVARRGTAASRLRRVADLRRLRVGLWDTVTPSFARSMGVAGRDVHTFADPVEALAALEAGRVDVLVGMQPDSASLVARTRGLVAVGLLPPRRFYVVRFPKRSALQRRVAAALRRLDATGVTARLVVETLGRLPAVRRLRA